MAFNVSTKLNGLDGLVKELSKLGQKTKNQMLRPAVRAGASILNKEMKKQAPKLRGLLKRSIGIKMKTYKNGTVAAILGARRGYKVKIGTNQKGQALYADPARYLHLVELGTSHSSPNPFMRRSIDATKKAVELTMAQKIREGLERKFGGVKS